MKHLHTFKLFENTFDQYNFRAYDNSFDLDEIVEEICQLSQEIPKEISYQLLEIVTSQYVYASRPDEITFSDNNGDVSLYHVRYLGDFCYTLFYEHIYDPYDHYPDEGDFPTYDYAEVFDDVEPLLKMIEEIISEF